MSDVDLRLEDRLRRADASLRDSILSMATIAESLLQFSNRCDPVDGGSMSRQDWADWDNWHDR